jgi:cyclic-di-AMP phosphodiesterase PgpH
MGRRPTFTTPLTRIRDTLVKHLIRPLDVFSATARFYIGFTVLTILTALLLFTNYGSAVYEDYKDGEIVKSTIVSPADVSTIDLEETRFRRDAARATTRPVFVYDSSRAETSAQSFQAAWEKLRDEAQNNPKNTSVEWTGEGGAPVARAIIAHRFDPEELDRLTSLLREIGSGQAGRTGKGYVFDDKDIPEMKQEIVLVDVQRPKEPMVMTNPQTSMTSLSAARRDLEVRVRSLSGWSKDETLALSAAMVPLIKPNVVLDQMATAAAREAEADRISPFRISLKRNQVLAREGDTVTPAIRLQLDAIKSSGNIGRPWQRLLGLLVLVAALFWVAWKFTEHRSTAVTLKLSKERTFALIGSAILVQTILIRVGFVVGDSVAAQRANAPFSDPMIWNFGVPFAAAALLVAMLVDAQLAFMTGIITSLFAGLLAQSGMQKSIYATIACAAAIYGIGRYRERQSVTIAGLLVGVSSAVMAVALMAYAEHPPSLKAVLLALAAGLVSGLLTAIFTAGGLPINESLFGILTDVKLLELSNADLPVLGQLALRAPGTNQHSHAVGQLAEEACRAVNANPLLARIGALYHDIGKLAAPDYFVENQQGSNPHDHLRPSQSAKIIISHVTYGKKLGKELGLPKPIRDFIPQHHGTRTLHFFLRKAQAEAKPGEVIDPADFRYPGPKPQSKEAAIMMLADSCEAAARSLAHPDPDNIRSIVLKIVDAIVSDGQLNECDISLREITTIGETMIHSLTAIYHARVDYPGFNPPTLSGSLPALPRPDLDSEERGVYTKTSEVPISKGGEVEDEAVTHRAAKR